MIPAELNNGTQIILEQLLRYTLDKNEDKIFETMELYREFVDNFESPQEIKDYVNILTVVYRDACTLSLVNKDTVDTAKSEYLRIIMAATT